MVVPKGEEALNAAGRGSDITTTFPHPHRRRGAQPATAILYDALSTAPFTALGVADG
jgi:hypothetical protein